VYDSKTQSYCVILLISTTGYVVVYTTALPTRLLHYFGNVKMDPDVDFI